MAAAVHGCGSPRQHHGSNISSANGCLAGSHQPHQPIYPTLPKYTRSPQQQLTTPNHHYIYGGNNPSAAHQYNSPLPSVSYLPVGTAQQHSMQKVYPPTAQRPTSAVAATDPCRNYWGHPHAATMMYRSGRHHPKRKSAVELLAETKNFYIKSEVIVSRLQQQSNYRPTNIIGAAKCGRPGLDSRDEARSKATYCDTANCSDLDRRFVLPPHIHQSRGAHIHHHHHHNHHLHKGCHGMAPNNNPMQNKLRVLLNGETSRERASTGLRANEYIRSDLPRQYEYGTNATSGTCGQELPAATAFVNEDNNAPITIPPPLFLSPQSFENVYNYGAENSSIDEPLILTENYRPISPPAEYAAESSHTNAEPRSRYNYQRSYSHSHEIPPEDTKYNTASYNINSHKSLPDLHSHISRHSPHSEILSCCSRGNRSIKSAGESSLNRDSGGSSGHYTHRSEPCYRQRDAERDVYSNKNCCNLNPGDFRRDSGSSTQHSANSYCGYVSTTYARTNEYTDCRCKNATHFESGDYLLNFTTPEVPEAFQDGYTPPSPLVAKYKAEEAHYASSSNQQLLRTQVVANVKHKQNFIIQSPGSAPSVEDISPPPITFKRQRCIRFKNRSRVALPPASVHSSAVNETGELTAPAEQPTFFFPKCFAADEYQTQEKPIIHIDIRCKTPVSHLADMENAGAAVDGLSDLEKFFDRLGLNDDKFHEIYAASRRRHSAESDSDDSSTVFFSDVSTVDSMRLPDSTETQPQTTQTFRPSEPPSIVERNARIIKWLCNCRKLQYA